MKNQSTLRFSQPILVSHKWHEMKEYWIVRTYCEMWRFFSTSFWSDTCKTWCRVYCQLFVPQCSKVIEVHRHYCVVCLWFPLPLLCCDLISCHITCCQFATRYYGKASLRMSNAITSTFSFSYFLEVKLSVVSEKQSLQLFRRSNADVLSLSLDRKQLYLTEIGHW